MRLVLATNNKNKIRELREIIATVGDSLAGIEVLTLSEAGCFEDPIEDGETFAENAEIKARAAILGDNIGIADDSGLCVDALNGAPGVYSARYSGSHGDDAANNRKLLAELEQVGAANRSGRYVCSMCCILPDGEVIRSEGTVEGRILEQPRGTGGFGYDCLFYVDEFGKTMAEMTPEEKNKISHRGKATREIIKKLNKKLGQNI